MIYGVDAEQFVEATKHLDLTARRCPRTIEALLERSADDLDAFLCGHRRATRCRQRCRPSRCRARGSTRPGSRCGSAGSSAEP